MLAKLLLTTKRLYFCAVFIIKPVMARMLELERPQMPTNYLPYLVILAVLLVPGYAFWQIFLSGKKPKGIVWAPSGKRGLFAGIKSCFACISNLQDVLLKARVLLNKGAPAVMISNLLDGALVILPNSCLKWCANQPTSLSFLVAHQQRFLLNYTLPDVRTSDPDIEKMLIKVLMRRSKGIVPELHSEMRLLETSSPRTTGWSRFNLQEEILKSLLVSTSRMLVGTPLCRDMEYLHLLSTYAMWVIPMSLLIKSFPAFLRPVVGGIVRFVLRRQFHRKIEAILLPIAKQVLSGQIVTEQDTFLKWYMEETKNNAKALDPDVVVSCIISINFAGIHTTELSSTQVMYHILSHEKADDLITALRLEIETVRNNSSEENWTWDRLEKLKLLDSVIRETLRLAPIDTIATPRIVTKPVTTPEGLDLPVGTKVCVSTLLAHHNEEWYPNAATFDPYRHVQSEATSSEPSYTQSYTISEKFLTFGYGTHTCPGRWLAIAETKMIIASMLTRYDFKPIEKPNPLWVGTMLVPSQFTNIMARPREKMSA